MNEKTPVWKVNPQPEVQHYVNSVAISSDAGTVVGGTYFLSYAGSGNHKPSAAQPFPVGVFAFNKAGGSLWTHQFSATEGVYWVALSRDGTWAASGGLLSYSKGFIYAYDASTGSPQLLGSPPTRTNVVALNLDGSYLVAGADALYVFSRSGSVWTPLHPIPVPSTDKVIAVAISDDGRWIVAGTYLGTVMLVANNNGALGSPVVWQLPKGSIEWIAIAADGSGFAVGASTPLGTATSVYFFNTQKFAGTKSPTWTAPLAGAKGSCRSVAVSGDGSLVSAVAANANPNATAHGLLFLFANNGTTGTLKWSQPLQHAANSTSIDSAGKFVTAADGFPDGTPGAFYLFDGAGTPLWAYPTTNMSWPMAISADATGIAAGSDDGNIYYFTSR